VLDNGESMDGQFVAGPDEKMVSFMALTEKVDANGVEEIKRLPLKQIIPFLRAEVGPPLDTVTNQLRELISNEVSPTFLLAAKGLDKRLQRIYDILDMYGDHGVALEDRVSVRAIVNELITELNAKAAKRNVIIEIVDAKQSLPPVFVNKALFVRALFECMDNAVMHSFNEEKSKRPIMVRLRFTELTDFLKIEIMNRVAPGTKKIDIIDTFVDVEGAETIKLGLGMVKQIMKLHGGEFHTSINDEDILDVTLQISLAPPGPGAGGVEDEQLMRYAEDVAALMAKRAKS
jgi:K+-sensing histidine kinase KdpD